MATSDDIISRLPNKPLLAPIDIALACGMSTTLPIYEAIECGTLSAVRINSKVTRISRAETIRWLRSLDTCRSFPS